MTMLQVMDFLHGNDPSRILDILNKAVHINNFDVNKKEAFHTGITFIIHTKTKFELLYEPWEQKLIIQRCDYIQLPCIAGLYTFSSNKSFFETYCTTKIISQIVDDDSAWCELETTQKQIDNNSFTHNFEIINAEDVVIKSLPYVFFNGRNEITISDSTGD